MFDAIKTRRSIRKYRSRPVEPEKLNRALEAGRISPSAKNMQPWHFILVTKEENRKALKAAYDADWFVDAPAIVVACGDHSKACTRRDGEEYWKVDVAITMQNMVLAARELGLGTCWIGAFDEDAAKRILWIPSGIRVLAMTPLGHPDEKKGRLLIESP